MKKALLLALAGIFALSFTLTACGDDDEAASLTVDEFKVEACAKMEECPGMLPFPYPGDEACLDLVDTILCETWDGEAAAECADETSEATCEELEEEDGMPEACVPVMCEI